MTAEDDWLEGGAEVASGAPSATAVPVLNLNKHELSRALDLPLKEIDRLVREGLPARPGTSKRDGLRFPSLPAAIEWIAEKRARDRAGPEDESIAGAKRRLALAKARAAELANAQKEGAVLPVEATKEWIGAAYGDVRERLIGLSSEIRNLTKDQQYAIDDAINSALEDISSEAWQGAVRVRALEKRKEGEAEEEEAAEFG